MELVSAISLGDNGFGLPADCCCHLAASTWKMLGSLLWFVYLWGFCLCILLGVP
jgi:hypothetical protein